MRRTRLPVRSPGIHDEVLAQAEWSDDSLRDLGAARLSRRAGAAHPRAAFRRRSAGCGPRDAPDPDPAGTRRARRRDRRTRFARRRMVHRRERTGRSTRSRGGREELRASIRRKSSSPASAWAGRGPGIGRTNTLIASAPRCPFRARRRLRRRRGGPVFAVHSRDDQVQPIGPTEQRIAELKKRGINAQIVVLNGIQHFETYKFVTACARRCRGFKRSGRRNEIRALAVSLLFSHYRCRSRRRMRRVGREVPRDSEAANIGEYMQRLSARPHHVGSPYDKDNAEWMLAQFKEWGWDAQHRDLRRAVPDAEGARARAGRADDVHGEARGAGGRRRSRRRARRPSSCRPTTPTRSTATSPAPLVYVNYGGPRTTTSSSGAASR